MDIINNTTHRLGDDLKASLKRGDRLKVAASCFSIYAFEALKSELSKIEKLDFIFTAPTFVPEDATDQFKRERREFFIPKVQRERSLYGSEFEIQLRNKLTQRAVARECANWIRQKATFRSNRTRSPMQQYVCIDAADRQVAYMPVNGFTAVDLGYQKGNAVSNIVNRFGAAPYTNTYLELFDQIWADADKLEDVTEAICQHIESVYQENSPERIYFLILYNLFNEFLEEIDEDVLPNDRTGYLDTVVWNKLFNYQRDAATGIINKLETYNGCILADSVGLGKTFTALAVIKYYELRNRAALVLCPKKLADNWLNYNSNLKTNLFAKDRFNYDVLCHTDLSRTSGESFGIPLNRVNWGNYDLVVIDESHNFRNNDIYKDKETRYQKLMNQVIREGVKTKVLMLSATPVNNRFTDLRNQLALAYEGESDTLSAKLKTSTSIEEIFRRAQAAFNVWSKRPPEERTSAAILQALDFDFFELLDSVTIARSRKHIETFYDTKDIGKFPERRKPLSFHCPLTTRADVMSLNEIVAQLSLLKLAIYAPLSYVLPSRISKYEALYDTEVGGGKGRLRQADRERSLQALMTTNLLKRLESSVEAFRLTLRSLTRNLNATLEAIADFERSGRTLEVSHYGQDNGEFSLTADETAARKHLTDNPALPDNLKETLKGSANWTEFAAVLETAEATEAVSTLKTLVANISVEGLESYIFNSLVWPRAPKFLYFDEYYQMEGQANLDALIKREDNKQLIESDYPLIGLINLARLDHRKLVQTRNTTELKNKLEGAGNHLTNRIVKYWSQNRHIQMRFDVRDAKPEDPPGMQQGVNVWGEVYDTVHWAHTPLRTRSRGFVWFFSFLAWYEDIKRQKQNVILLLDEPGLSLHGRAQADLLRYFEAELSAHQLIYTTHSPFMIDPAKFERVRIVQDLGIDAKEQLPKDQDGTKVLTNVFDATDDSLFPLQGALGYEIQQTLFIGPNSLVVEGPADMLILRAVSAQLEREGRIGLSENWVITPVGGSGKVPAFVALLAPQKGLNVATLLDIQNSDRALIEDLYKKKLLKRKQVAAYADFTGTNEADVEDMFERDFYISLVNAEFAKELKAAIPVAALNAKEPRTLRAIEAYLEKNALKSGAFGHYRPARYFSENAAMLWPQISDATKARFEEAFRHLNALLK